jgi:AcrR family transcriptional regulator
MGPTLNGDPLAGVGGLPHPGIFNAGGRPDGARQASAPGSVVAIQRARLLVAMVEVCAERGASNATVAHVVERAGVSRRTFYELFANREDCFLAAFDDAIARASRYVLDAYDPSARWAERIRRSLIALLSFFDVEGGVGRLLIVGSLGAGVRALERRGHVLDQIINVVDEGRVEARAGSPAQGAPGLPPLTAEVVVGGVLSVLQARLLDPEGGSLLALTGPLMSMIVLPYLGLAAARRELARPAPRPPRRTATVDGDPLREMGMRLTYRTVRVLTAVAALPGGSNRQIADGSGIADQGQISKLLARLHGLGLIENTGADSVRGAPNSWVLTDRGRQVQGALVAEAGGLTVSS